MSTPTQERLKELFIYKPEIGEFVCKIDISRKRKKGSSAGKGKRYRVIRVDGSLYYAHRLAWIYMHGVLPPEDIDHKDDALRNALENLRPCTASENGANMTRPRNNTSGFKGVTWDRQTKSWRAQIQAKKVRYTLGLYASPIDAALAYDVAAIAKFGRFAKTNGMLGLLE